MLENPKLLAKLKAEGKPSFEVPEEFKNKCVSEFLSPSQGLSLTVIQERHGKLDFRSQGEGEGETESSSVGQPSEEEGSEVSAIFPQWSP